MAADEENVELSNRFQGTTNFCISIIWLFIYILSFLVRNRKKNTDNDIVSDANQDNDAAGMNSSEDLSSIDRDRINATHLRVVATLYPFIFTLRYVTYVIDWFVDDFEESQLNQRLVERIQDGLFVLGLCIFHLYMILGLKYGVKFEEFVYIIHLEKCTVYLCYSLLFIIFLVDSAYFVFRDISKSQPQRVHSDIPAHLFWIVSVFNVILGGILIGRFSNQIHQFIKSVAQSRSPRALRMSTPSADARNGESDNDDVIGLTAPQRMFLGIAIKYGLLCGIAIVCTNIQFCGWILLNFEILKVQQSRAILNIWRFPKYYIFSNSDEMSNVQCRWNLLYRMTA